MNIPIAIKPQEVNGIWKEILPLLQAACEYNGGRYIAENYLVDFLNSDKQLWLVRNEGVLRALIVTQIVLFPQKKCCMIDICTGEGLSEWGHFTSIIEDWARSLDCDQMFLVARPGMERLLREFQYTKTHVFFEKELI